MEDAGVQSSQPESTRQPQFPEGCRDRHGGGAVLNEGSDLFGGTEIGLVDDAGLAVHAGTFDDVVIELVLFEFRDEGRHRRVIQVSHISKQSQ
jgi:hypothetical protein